jgi:hypothetical protein
MLDGLRAGGQSEALSLAVFPSHLQLKLMAAFAINESSGIMALFSVKMAVT